MSYYLNCWHKIKYYFLNRINGYYEVSEQVLNDSKFKSKYGIIITPTNISTPPILSTQIVYTDDKKYTQCCQYGQFVYLD